jgi:hypothetical protein
MAFDGNEEVKDSMMMESLDDRYMKERRSTTKQPAGAHDRAGSSSARGAMASLDEQFNAAGGILIDLLTLKKLLNRVTCEFILSLIHGTAVAPGMIQSTEKQEKDS